MFCHSLFGVIDRSNVIVPYLRGIPQPQALVSVGDWGRERLFGYCPRKLVGSCLTIQTPKGVMTRCRRRWIGSKAGTLRKQITGMRPKQLGSTVPTTLGPNT